ncbi:MAG: hypothetical protein Q7W02_00085 [Candidatus Rokubacteria bacterium]|nr:hypothetical protein [Candidatus Rokubacteria bacterium]
MPSEILSAFVKLFADDSSLRASFQALAPSAHLAGITVGDRFAAGMAKAAAQAHAAFTKDFIGPLQSEATGSLIGRGMEARPQDQFRAADLALNKGIVTAVQSHGQALAKSGEKAEAWNLSVREGTQSARIFAGTIVSAVNPQLGAMVQVGGEAVRAMKGLGVAGAGVGTGLAIGTVALGFYIERVKGVVDAKARLDAAVFNKDPGAAQAEVAKRTAEFDDLVSKKEQAAQRTGARSWFGFGARERSFQEMIAFFSVLGKDVETSRKELAESQADTDKLTRTVTFPKIDAKAGIEASQLLIQQIGLQRQSAETVDQLADSTQRLRAAKLELVEATIKEMDAGERVKAQNIFDAAAKRGTPVAQDVQDKILGDITRRQSNLRAAARSADEEDRRKGNADLIALEDRQQAHAVRMGRISISGELEAARAAMGDPRRSLQEQQDAESRVFQTQRAMAESLLTFQGQISGKSMFKEQLEVQRGFLAEIAEAGGAGSRVWLDNVSKISDLYKGIREQAKGIFSQQASIAESRASREGLTSISIDDVPDLLRRVREQDERALRGDRVPIGDIGAAVGRVDLFRQMDKEGLSPRETLSRLMEDPSKQLARAIEGLTGGAGDTTPVLTGLADAATLATRALLGLAGASARDGGAGTGMIRRPPGGPQMSEENRQAIMDAIAGRLQDEQLAVYGRR